MTNYMDHHSFLVENDLMTDEMKDNIAMAGYCIVENVIDVETIIDFNEKEVKYIVTIPSKLYSNLALLKRYKDGEKIGFWNSWRLKRFLKKKRELEQKEDIPVMGYQLEEIANMFVRGYLNKNWSATVELIDVSKKNEGENIGLHNPRD